MTLDRAREILELPKGADIVTAKRQYHRLLMKYHPDVNAGDRDHRKAQEIIEAYRVIADTPVDEEISAWWAAPTIDTAMPERPVYVRYSFFDHEELPAVEVARGRYLWDPELEEFALLCRSVMEVCRGMAADGADSLKDTFHRMMRTYVRPEYCLERLNAPSYRNPLGMTMYSFRCHIAVTEADRIALLEEGMDVDLDEDYNRISASVTAPDGEKLAVGNLTFDEDHLYYVILPIFQERMGMAHARIEKIEHRRKGRERQALCLVQLEAGLL